MDVKAMDLYDAYKKNMLPKDEGYVVSGFFMNDTPYTIMEIVSYSEVKNFYTSGDSITFQSNGKKIYILVEPTTYTMKAQEPYVRPSKFQIPLRFNDLEIYTCRNQYKIMYSKEPQMVMTSFTILKPSGLNFSFIVFAKTGLQQTLSTLLQKTLSQNANLPLADSKKVADILADKVIKELSWPNKEGTEKAAAKAVKAKAEAKTVKAEKPAAKAVKAKAEPKIVKAEKPAAKAVKAKAEPKTAKAEKSAAKAAKAKAAKAKAEPKTVKAEKPAAKAVKAKAEPKTVKAEKPAAKAVRVKAEPKTVKAEKPAAKAVKTKAKAEPKTVKAEKPAAKAVKAKVEPKTAKAEPKTKGKPVKK